MKHRLLYLLAVLVPLLSVGLSLMQPQTASAAVDVSNIKGLYYTGDAYTAIQGPNPFAVADQSENVTYRKAADTSQSYGFGKGIYVAIGSPHTDNAGGTCYPAIQTNNKQYNGDTKGKIYNECGSYGKSEQSNAGSVTISKTAPNGAATQSEQVQVFEKELCPGVKNLDDKLYQEVCSPMPTSQKERDEAANKICTKYSNQLKAQCEDYDNRTYNPDNEPGAAEGDTEPTCETSGGPLAWILCPIFNLMADSSQWMFQNLVEPFLITPPISTNPGDPSFQIWSNLRIYGNIFLIIALLVIVFGESIGGGLIDAYTAKKVLPRLLVAAVLINLSLYIVAFLVDLSNILGQGVGAILTSPLTHCDNGAGGNCWDFQLTNGDQARVFGVGLIGLFAGGTAIAGFLGTIIFGGFAGISAAITVAFFVMLPIFFAILAVFITLIIRKGLILMLVLISPIAFALYCLPNTQRYFKRWWDLLIEALMVYPIIVAIFAIAEIMSVTILSANGISASDLQSSELSNQVAGNLNRTLALVVAFLLQFLPLLAVPFAFRIAGGALAKVYDFATGAGGKISQMAENRREQAKKDYRAQAIPARARMYHGALKMGASDTSALGLRRRASVFAAKRAGGYNIEALNSAVQAEKIKEAEDQIATGRDEEIRGLTVDKASALRGRGLVKRRDGTYMDASTRAAVAESDIGKYDYQTDESSGTRSFQSLGGAWINEQDVDAGHRRWGRDKPLQQAALQYEGRKAITEEQSERYATHYAGVAKEGWGMSDEQAGGAWIGAAFANQNQHVEFKHTDWKTGKLKDGGKGLVTEVFENKGSYELSRMNSHTIEQLRNAHRAARTKAQSAGTAAERAEAEKIMKDVQSVAETFMQRYGGGSRQVGVAGDDDNQQPIIVPPNPQQGQGGQSGESYQASSQGSAHMAERVRQFAEEVGVYRPLDGSGDTHSAGPPPTNPRHN